MASSVPRAATNGANEIPVVNFSAFAHGDLATKRAVGNQIADICNRVGFFYLSGHGVPQAQIDRIFAEAARFFRLSLAEKEALAFHQSRTRRGYMGELQENFGRHRREAGDMKEMINLGLEFPADTPELIAQRPFYGGNQWPRSLPEWRELQIAYLERMVTLGRSLMSAFALGLGLTEDYFASMLERPMTSLRLLHYPPDKIVENSPSCGEHTDYGCLTMLAQDSVGGLQVQTRDGRWVDAVPIPGTFVINVGDMLAFWTNGRFRSTPHRVTTPKHDRYSVVVFLHPHIDTPLAPLDGSGAGKVPTAGEHNLKRVTAAYPAD